MIKYSTNKRFTLTGAKRGPHGWEGVSSLALSQGCGALPHPSEWQVTQ